MKIGNRKYKVKSSECWLVFREGYNPQESILVEVWTEKTDTYWLVGPISISNFENFFQSNFLSDFILGQIDDVDSTLMECDKAIDIWNQKVNFDQSNFFNVQNVEIHGETSDNEIIRVSSSTYFAGFEIWKTGNYLGKIKDLELPLKKLDITYLFVDETENEIRIEIKTEPNTLYI